MCTHKQGIRGTGRKAYKEALGHCLWEKVSTPSGGESWGLMENHRAHCAFSQEANRSTLAFLNLPHIVWIRVEFSFYLL